MKPSRVDVINQLAKSVRAQSYLEIGVSDGRCIRNVQVPSRESVDPDSSVATYHMTSDAFFAGRARGRTWDLIFVDGYHEKSQALRDIAHALVHLSEHGAIVVHDCDPKTEAMQKVPCIQSEWTGDVWKAWATLRANRSDLDMRVVDCDYGCGVIRRGAQQCIVLEGPLEWPLFVQRRAELLNLVTWYDWVLSLQHEVSPR